MPRGCPHIFRSDLIQSPQTKAIVLCRQQHIYTFYTSMRHRTYSSNNWYISTGLILGLHPTSVRHRCKVTPSPTGWAQTSTQPLLLIFRRCYKDYYMTDYKCVNGSMVTNIPPVILVKQTVGRHWTSTGMMAYAVPSQAITRWITHGPKCQGCPTDICGISVYSNRSGLRVRDRIGWRKIISYFKKLGINQRIEQNLSDVYIRVSVYE